LQCTAVTCRASWHRSRTETFMACVRVTTRIRFCHHAICKTESYAPGCVFVTSRNIPFQTRRQDNRAITYSHCYQICQACRPGPWSDNKRNYPCHCFLIRPIAATGVVRPQQVFIWQGTSQTTPYGCYYLISLVVKQERGPFESILRER
jgi:hypothetical protein